MKHYVIALSLLLFSATLVGGNTVPESNDPEIAAKKKTKDRKAAYKIPRYNKKLLAERMQEIEQLVDLPFNTTVYNFINDFVIRGRQGSEEILGLSAIYFPIFEKYLEAYNVPPELKYLPIVESALAPTAVSPVGATGLWQFMKPTARLMGLTIDNYVDERYDIHKSSEAAAKYLRFLFDRYQNWTLAIAAYNCGPGTLDEAIHKAHSKNFWKLKKYLPKETQNYIPKFIAVNYVMNFYLFHDLRPKYPDYTLQLTEVSKVYKRKSFKEISGETGFSMQLIEYLNPTYKKKIIPPNAEGHLLMLPQIGLIEEAEPSEIGRNRS